MCRQHEVRETEFGMVAINLKNVWMQRLIYKEDQFGDKEFPVK